MDDIIMSETTEVKLLSLQEIWDNFVKQLEDARENLSNKEKEMEAESSMLTRIDLTEYNDLKTIVLKLEAALEAFDIVRVNVYGEPSLIQKSE